MKNRKLYAILTLVAFMMTILPVAAFAATTYSDKSVSLTASLVDLDKNADADGEDEVEMTIYLRDNTNKPTATLVYGSDKDLYIWFERYTEQVSDADIVKSVKVGDTVITGYKVAGYEDKAMVKISQAQFNAAEGNRDEVKVELVSSTVGVVEARAAIPTSVSDVYSDVVKNKAARFSATPKTEFEATSSSNWKLDFEVKKGVAGMKANHDKDSTGKILEYRYTNQPYSGNAGTLVADGVTKAEFYVYVKDAQGNPVVNEKVKLSVNKSGAELDTEEETTNSLGRIEFGVTATKSDKFRVTAEAASQEMVLELDYAGAKPYSIEISDQPNGPIAIDTDPGLEFKLYDIHGNLVDNDTLKAYVEDLNTVQKADEKYATVVSSPSGSNLENKHLEFYYGDGKTGDFDYISLNFKKKPDKVGTYKIKAALENGKYAEVVFEVKEQGKIVKMTVDIKEDRLAWNASTKSPTVKLYDADGVYKKEDNKENYTWTVDNSALASINSKGVVTAKDGRNHNYRTGTVVVTAVDTRRNLTASDSLVIGSDVSSAKVVSTTSAVVGEKAVVEIQLVDADGNDIALDAENRGKIEVEAYKIAAPAGAKVGWDLPNKSDYQKTLSRTGKMKIDVTSDVAGEVALQVVIEQKDGYTNTKGEKEDVKLSVPVTVKFGTEKPTYGAQNLTLFIGSTGYVVDGNAKVSDLAPFIKDDRTFVPVRVVATALGATNEDTMWDAATETVTLVRGDMTATLKIGNNVINVVKDGVAETVVSDVAAFIDANTGRTVLPFRAIAEVFGAEVEAVFAADGTTTAVTFAQK